MVAKGIGIFVIIDLRKSLLWCSYNHHENLLDIRERLFSSKFGKKNLKNLLEALYYKKKFNVLKIN